MTEQTKRLLNEFASALEAAGALARQIAEREPAQVVLEIDKKAILEKVAANFLDDTRRITLDLGCQRPSESALNTDKEARPMNTPVIITLSNLLQLAEMDYVQLRVPITQNLNAIIAFQPDDDDSLADVEAMYGHYPVVGLDTLQTGTLVVMLAMPGENS